MNARRSLLVTAVALWAVAVGAGMVKLWQYSLAPGEPGTPPAAWPTDSHISRRVDKLALIMTLHPRCPCSRASVGELAKLMALSQKNIQAYVVFVAPPGSGEDWVKTDLWRSTGLIPGAIRLIDDGREARLFGAATSGDTAVYDSRGRLVFNGGITGARGHFGDNAGENPVAEIAHHPDAGKTVQVANSPVYGCPLFAPGSSKKGVETCPR